MKNSKARIYFRADANPAIGYGHFIRSLALADMLKEHFDCVFVTVNPTMYQKAEIEAICSCILLPEGEAHFETFLSLLKGDEIVVLDNYFFTTEYQERIKSKGCKLVCIDDMHNKHYVADIIINPVITNDLLFSKEPYTQCCLGHQWALLRKVFLAVNNHSKEPVFPYRHVIVCFGGSDPHNLTGSVLSILKDISSVAKITAIVGDSYRGQTVTHPKISILKNLTAEQIARLFSEADLAILSSSTVCLEAKACRIPVAAGYYIDNQKQAYETYTQLQEIYPLGNLTDEGLESKIKQALSAKPALGTISFDGIRERYVSLFARLLEIKNYVIDNLVFINYINLDSAQHRVVWEARNDDRIRCWMEHPESFSFESHLTFIEKLQKSDCRYWAVYKDGTFIASVNLQIINEVEAERGIFIAPELFGKGIATEVEDAAEKLYRQIGLETIQAYIVKNNIRSLNYHLKRDYIIYKEDEVHIYLRKDLK